LSEQLNHIQLAQMFSMKGEEASPNDIVLEFKYDKDHTDLVISELNSYIEGLDWMEKKPMSSELLSIVFETQKLIK
jgi:hypothetical protein